MQRRTFLKVTGAGTLAAFVQTATGAQQVWAAPVAGGTLPPSAVPQFRTPLVVPARMPRSGTAYVAGRMTDLYEIGMRQVSQQVLPSGLPTTQVFAYGPLRTAALGAPTTFRSPGMTIETTRDRPVRIRWVNQLKDSAGRPLPHLLPVDPTLHWANPGGGPTGRDTRPRFTSTPGPYRGPVPTTVHVHGATHVGDESDGYPESWYLPSGVEVPTGWANVGTWHDFLGAKAQRLWGSTWRPGEATHRYPVADRACLNWYHDHALGVARLNTYAGLLGMFVVRGGAEGDGAVRDARTGLPGSLPGPYPDETDYLLPRSFREIPLAISDRSFNSDGSLFYPDSRAFHDGAAGPYVPESDLSPIWNPEFFGNMICVNGTTWPRMDVERRRYRLRVLNACGSRVLVLDFTAIPGVKVHQIGNDGGFLPAPDDLMRHRRGRLLLAPSERADLVVDLGGVAPGSYTVRNLGPDAPYAGGEPGVDFAPADPATTGRVLQLRVAGSLLVVDTTTPAASLRLPTYQPLGSSTRTRRLALVEQTSTADDGPRTALLGVVKGNPATGPCPVEPMHWGSTVTENPGPGVVETWEVYNTTEDAHPVHVHESKFEVLDRQPVLVTGGEAAVGGQTTPTVRLDTSVMRRPAPAGERNLKDTVVAYPGEVTRIKVRFTTPGQYVWHSQVAEREDNEMVRVLRIGPEQAGQPADSH